MSPAKPAEPSGALPALLLAARVQDVRQPVPSDIVIATHGPAGSAHWLLSTDSFGARFVQTFTPGKNAPQPGQFLLWLRTRLAGARVERLAVSDGLVVDLGLKTQEAHFHLVLEMNGRDSNLLLLDAERHILASLHAPKSAPGVDTVYAPPVRLHRYPQADPPRLPAGDPAEAEELDARWRELVAAHEFSTARTEAERRIKALLAKLRRRLDNIEADRDAAPGAEALRERAELLQIHRQRLKPGMVEITVPNEFQPERPEVTIPLDPGMGANENIARMFQRYQKQRDGAAHVERRWADTRGEMERWEALQAVLGEAGTHAQLDAMLAALTPAQRKAIAPQSRGQGQREEARGVMTRTSADGYTIYVGRSKTENDEVTFRIGRGRDWWLHALGVPGAHVLVRNPSDGPLPPATLRQAAWLAAYYSKGRKQGGLEVTCTQRKHVRKVKGGEPGQVTHALGRTVWVSLDDAQARAILGEVDGGELDL
jgi:predicted ribosome quality control (RQC) complex YloA/Tae2 family protein